MSIFLVSSYLTRCHSLIDRKPLETFHLPWYSSVRTYIVDRDYRTSGPFWTLKFGRCNMPLVSYNGEPT